MLGDAAIEHVMRRSVDKCADIRCKIASFLGIVGEIRTPVEARLESMKSDEVKNVRLEATAALRQLACRSASEHKRMMVALDEPARARGFRARALSHH